MVLRRTQEIICHYYLQYLLLTALYMLEPWERMAFTTVLVAVLAMGVYTAYVFLPLHISAALNYLQLI
uniref:Serine palmitoyltransferase small subunit B n=1 Tax=Eptatretus burgeri TaxID=7764 RepID=A0A8C4Q9I9_EPTBU